MKFGLENIYSVPNLTETVTWESNILNPYSCSFTL